MQFINYCNKHNILFTILFPHSTHQLQPLDVSVFFPFTIAYSNEINKFIQSNQAFSRVTKRSFWMLFQKAWKSALTTSNILSGFAATGIWPFNPTRILSKLQAKTPTPPSSDEELKRKTPNSVRGVRRAIKALREEDPALGFGVDLIVRGMEKLVVEKDILQHQVDQLRGTIVNEKKRRKRGKNMGLFIKNEPKQAMFFSPSKIAAARARQEELNTQKEEERLAKEAEKQRKVFEREQKAQEARNRKIARQEAAAQKREAKERKKEVKMSNAEASIEWIISICLPLSKFYVGVWSSKYMRMTKLLGDRCHAVAMWYAPSYTPP